MRIALAIFIRNLCVVVCGALLLGACSSNDSLPPPSFATDAGQGLAREYQLNISDKLKLAVFGEPQLSGEYEVNSLGQVSLPLIGEVRAKGHSLSAFRDVVRRKYAQGFLNNPKVTVEVMNYRPIFVHGEVKRGGVFNYKNGLKIRDAVAMAGGYTYRADESSVLIVRDGYPAARLRLPSQIEVLPGDNIRVEERFF